MRGIKQYGENVPGFDIPVLNERAIRASAGCLFVVMFAAVAFIELQGNYLLLKYFITAFVIDFFIRVFVQPRYSPTLILGRLIVSRQNPEYVGAAQKKFAWSVGFLLSGIMFVLMVLLNSRSIFSSVICGMCLIFLFFESAFGICLGCLVYRWFYREKAMYCPGEVCDAKTKKDTGKIISLQVFIALAFLLLILLMYLFFNDQFRINPGSLQDRLGFGNGLH
jgi:hypothetical protein